MADRKITDLTALTTPASADVLPIVDVSEAAAADKNKKITVGELFKGVPDGTAAAPAIAFESDDGNGIFLSTTDTVGIATNGSSRMTVSTTAVASTLPVIVPDGTAAAPSVAFTGSGTDTGIYSPGVDQVAISTGGTGRLFIDSAGNVGIGAAPSHALDVNGQVQAKGQIYLTDSSGNDVIRFTEIGSRDARMDAFNGTDFNGTLRYAGANLVFETGTSSVSERLRITSDGKLGLGTSSPVRTLHVTGTATNAAQFENTNANTVGVELKGNAGTSSIFHNSNNLTFYPNGVEKVRITSDGKVGIGTTSAQATLHVSGSASGAYIGQIAENTNSGGYAQQLFYVGANGANGTASVSYAPGIFFAVGPTANDTTTPIVFRNSNATERARIDTSGRLLVGTSTASGGAFIQVVGRSGAATDNSQIRLGRGSSVAGADSTLGVLLFTDNTDNTGAYIYSQSDGSWTSGSSHPGRLVFSTTASGAAGPTERMRINSDGVISGYTGGIDITRNVDSAAATGSFINSSATTGNQYGVYVRLDGDPNNTSQYFLDCFGSTTQRARIRSNGGLANYQSNNVDLSDERTKRDISSVSSTWNCVQA